MTNDVVSQIAATINQVLAESGRAARSFSAAETLMGDMGLDSLDIAVVVVQLEQKLGVDPFRHGSGGVRTYGDFVDKYLTAVLPPTSHT